MGCVAEIPLRHRKLLWIKSGGKCAFDGCRQPLAIEIEQSGRTSIVSQEAHIVAEKPDGPRGVSPLATEERNSYPNLILLCLNHHKIIDDDPETFTVDVLLKMKVAHEEWFESLRSPADIRRETGELMMVDLIEEWERRIALDNWASWVARFLQYSLQIDDALLVRLHQLALWLFSRPWPDVFPTLVRAFENMQRVANGLFAAADNALEYKDSGRNTRQWIPDHKKLWLPQEEYEKSTAESEWVRDFFGDLAFELTRAANWVCDEIRLSIDPRYRFDLGVLVVERQEGLGSSYYRPRYRPAEIAGHEFPYRGLRDFIDDRAGRDVVLGKGWNQRGARRVAALPMGAEK